jgi:hypothetical protein
MVCRTSRRGQDEVGELGIERQDGAVQLGADHEGRDHAVVEGRGARVAGDDLGEARDVGIASHLEGVGVPPGHRREAVLGCGSGPD